MLQKLRFIAGLVLLLILSGLVAWQGSFTVGEYGPRTTEQIYVYWGLSTLIFLLTVLVGFMIFRDSVKLYVARRAGKEGSRIRTKILLGAVMLTFLPSLFLVLWSVAVLNRNLDKWFSRPAVGIQANLRTISSALETQTQQKGDALAKWVAHSPEMMEFLANGDSQANFRHSVCFDTDVVEAFVRRPDGGQIAICRDDETPVGNKPPPERGIGKEVESHEALPDGMGTVVLRTRMPLDLEGFSRQIARQLRDYDLLASGKREMRRSYLQLLLLITLFIFFIATWVALFLARQIVGPVSALLEAARAVRGGNLAYRVSTPATDEFASLVRAFNEMTEDLEVNRKELERRRRFIEAVLESIPTGVISLGHDGTIQFYNNALTEIFPEREIGNIHTLSQLFPDEHADEISRLLKRARRTGVANRQLEAGTGETTRHLSITVSALDAKVTSGFVMVLEDTSELLQAQKAAAWHEVARRIAHELKNPLTPIALSSERIQRQMEKCDAPPEVKRIVRDCCATIGREVESVKNLVDEFSSFARFPAAHPVPGHLNTVVEEALAVFEGRLGEIALHRSLDENLPLVALDREQFKRVVVNLVDNAAEAMQEAALKELFVITQTGATAETVELVIADTGCGITIHDKEKLFLPYFSTKKRGTGLGLAIVSHIVAEHHAQIRVEDNAPAGARFIIELPAHSPSESDPRPVEVSV